MFERYTEKARRVIFFARYEASQFGSPYIATEHLLLGLLREDKVIALKLLKENSVDLIYKKIDSLSTRREKTSTAVDLPLSKESKRVLAYAAEEAERLGHRHIGTEHLLLGLLRKENGLGAQLLNEVGVTLDEARQKIASWPAEQNSAPVRASGPSLQMTEVHGRSLPLAILRARAEHLGNFAWIRRIWKPLDMVVDNQGSGISFDLSLRDETRYKFVQGGWTREPCAICGWELSAEGGPERSEGFTNGRLWLCTECYHRYVARPSTGAA
jgi:Clp amino terminal domain, pathogenicity island component